MTEEVEIDPGFGAASLSTSQQCAIECARLVKVGHVESKVKYGHGSEPYLANLSQG